MDSCFAIEQAQFIDNVYIDPTDHFDHSSLSSRISANLRLIAWSVSYADVMRAYLFSLGRRDFSRDQSADL
jgi:hypothetical protein